MLVIISVCNTLYLWYVFSTVRACIDNDVRSAYVSIANINSVSTGSDFWKVTLHVLDNKSISAVLKRRKKP
jgi:hypothetical protein